MYVCTCYNYFDQFSCIIVALTKAVVLRDNCLACMTNCSI